MVSRGEWKNYKKNKQKKINQTINEKYLLSLISVLLKFVYYTIAL